MNAINLAEKLALFDDAWSPEVAGDFSEHYVKFITIDSKSFCFHQDYEPAM